MSDVDFDKDGITGQTVRHNLNFYWIIDDSGSMHGQKIQSVNFAIKDILPRIQDIESHERVNILMRVIKFGDTAEWYVGPEPVPAKQFVWNDLSANSGITATAQAIDLLVESLDPAKLGLRNLPPVAILMSDGYCTDSNEHYQQAIDKLNSSPWGTKAVRIAIGIGNKEREEYNKDQLDQFISPYLRQERNLETLGADNVKKLVNFIRVVSTVAIQASTSSKSDTKNDVLTPVDIDVDSLEEEVDLDEDLDGVDWNQTF